MKVVSLRQVSAFNTWATAKFFLKRIDEAITRVSLALRGGPGKGLPESWYAHLPEPEGDYVLGNLILAMSCGDEQPLTSWTMWGGAVQVTPDRPHRTLQSPIAICA